MANTPQSEKRARQSEARAKVNKMRKSRIRTFIRKVEEAIASGDHAAAQAAFEQYDFTMASAIAMIMGVVQLCIVLIVLVIRNLFYRGATSGGKG